MFKPSVAIATLDVFEIAGWQAHGTFALATFRELPARHCAHSDSLHRYCRIRRLVVPNKQRGLLGNARASDVVSRSFREPQGSDVRDIDTSR
jgi:hypothetical protein